MRKLVMTVVAATLTIATTSCNSAKKVLKQNDFEYQKQMAKMLTTTRNNRFIEVGATGNAMTFETAVSIAELNAKAKASRVIAEVLNEARAQKTENNLSDSRGGDRSLSTDENFQATITAQSKSLLQSAEVVEVAPGVSNDGSREKMVVVRVRVPLQNSSYSLLAEVSDEKDQ